MKKLIIILFLCISVTLSAADHYVATGGGGLGTYASPFASIAQVNAHTFVAGDNIFFNRGDTFVGTIDVDVSGSSGSPITFGAYGTGDDPIITGFTTISGWTNEGSGIYSKTFASEGNRVEVVTVDGVLTAMGRYPDAGSWLVINSASGNASFTDNELPSSPSWTGAEVVLRKYSHLVDRAMVTNHSGQTIYYTEKAGGSGATGYGADNGYFFQADLKTLTALGEWYYDGSKLYMYFGAVDPTTKVVKVATVENAILCVQDYIGFSDLLIEGFNSTAIEHYGGDYLTVSGCEIRFIGGRTAVLGSYTTFDDCNIHDTHSNALDVGGWDFTVTNTTFENISMLVGGGYGYSGNGYCIIGSEHTALIENCSFENIGYDGVFMQGYDVTVRNNFFNNCVARHYDGGAIYMTGHNARIVTGNVIVNIQGSINMIENQTFGYYNTVEGVYLDEPVSNITVTNNSIYNVRGNGIKLHKAHDIVVTNNTIANCVEGFQILNMTNQPLDPVRNLTINGNKIISYTDDQFFINAWSAWDDIDEFGTFGTQIYSRPVDDGEDEDFFTEEPSDGDSYGGWRTFAQWKTISGQDATSSYSTVTTASVDNLHFIYNETGLAKSYNLSDAMEDVSGVEYSGNIYLEPYTSLLLIGVGTVAEGSDPPPDFATVITSSITDLIDISATSGGNVTSPGGGTVTARGVCWDTSINPTISDDKTEDGSGTGIFVSYLTGLTAQTIYYIRAYATNGTGTSYGDNVTFTTPKGIILANSGKTKFLKSGSTLLYFASTTAPTPPASTPLTDGVIALWRMDENTGSTLNDSIASNDLTLSGATIGAVGKIGRAVDFTNVTDYLQKQTASLTMDECTVSLWFKLDNLPATGYVSLFQYTDNTDWASVIEIRVHSTGAITVGFGNSTHTTFTASTSEGAAGTGSWFHIVAVNLGDNNDVELYGNGVGSHLTTETFSGTLNTGNYIVVGNQDYTESYAPDGLIDNVVIWNRALSSDDISNLYTKENVGTGYPWN